MHAEHNMCAAAYLRVSHQPASISILHGPRQGRTDSCRANHSSFPCARLQAKMGLLSLCLLVVFLSLYVVFLSFSFWDC
ncbi:hypothetical protein DUNSADRAFT_1683 [Dunaliella salina]|uniref:Encoded protein n=1 Tax=Dunaliella salina TaxID=3046 RepID=A0ABQ7GWT9_DUNSA|nr:hypothetical protein DUNSADRAFT_1683 [Dunaliella salina]|eukprot:KAF5839066.1 hypothetical protein DUNSADRAFT_1683 [Dunaliella salina]